MNTAGIVIMVCSLVGMNLLPGVFDTVADWSWANAPLAALTFALPVGAAILYKKLKPVGVFVSCASSLVLIFINLSIAFF